MSFPWCVGRSDRPRTHTHSPPIIHPAARSHTTTIQHESFGSTHTRELDATVTALGSSALLLDVKVTELTAGGLDDADLVGPRVVPEEQKSINTLFIDISAYIKFQEQSSGSSRRNWTNRYCTVATDNKIFGGSDKGTMGVETEGKFKRTGSGGAAEKKNNRSVFHFI